MGFKTQQTAGGGGGGSVNSVNSGTDITVDNTDPANPIINFTGAFQDPITVVANYSALPSVGSVTGKFYWCSASQGTKWLPGSLGGTYYSAGLYYSNGVTWEFVDVPYQATQSAVNAGVVTDQFVTPATLANYTGLTGKVDSVSGTANQIGSSGGTTPVISIVSSAILPGSPTIVSPGNSTQNIITTDATQTLTNKTLTSPTLTTPALGAATGTSLVLSSKIDEAKGADIASATTTNIGAATGNYVNITGTTIITAFDTVQAGTRRILNFNGALTLTYNATSLILPGSANITTVAGDVATFISLGSGNWVCIDYSKVSQTGTGKTVLATSPALVTPDLGTPSAGVLTNATGYTIANLVGAAWVDWSASDSLVGFSSTTIHTNRYIKIGRLVIHYIEVSGTSNAITITMVNPFTSITQTDVFVYLGAMVTNGGTTSTVAGGVLIGSNTTSLSLLRDRNSTAWTNTGVKTWAGFVIYESTT